MVTLTSIRNKLTNKVFNKFGDDIALNTLSSSSDKWGDQTTINITSSTYKGVPHNYFPHRKEFQPFGVLDDGEVDIVFPYTATITEEMVAVYNGTSYDVFDVEQYPYAGGTIAQLARLKERTQ